MACRACGVIGNVSQERPGIHTLI
uniref:Uncharacterized protein n=1 Tax=Anguilla anguilla TaxID=7936 RepID=A0A0E9RIT8_ANGAN